LRGAGRLVDLHRGERFPIVPPWRARYAPGTHTNREHWFVLELNARRMIRTAGGEHRQYRWLPAAQAMARASSWTNRQLIRAWAS
jgi:dATP pyrophosphohydrolase